MILGIDQGSSSTRALLVDRRGRKVAHAAVGIRTFFPQPGFVEHRADEIFDSVLEAVARVLRAARVRASALDGVGLACQRSTCLLFDRATGKALTPCASWQCGRAADDVARMVARGAGKTVRRIAGLPLIGYAAAAKLGWLLRHSRARQNDLAASTLDAFLVHRLTGGATFATDPSIAARTLLFDWHRLEWSRTLLELFRVPPSILPEVVPSGLVRGVVSRRFQSVLPEGLPIAASLGDQQASLIGMGVLEAGDAKITYGTGAFVLVQEGTRAPRRTGAFLPAIAWSTPDQVHFALEGAVPAAGASLSWLAALVGRGEAELLGEIDEPLALDGPLFLPALTGLGPPEWLTGARGVFASLGRGHERRDLTRGVLEGIAWSVARVVEQLEHVRGARIRRLVADGGLAASRAFLDLQSAVLGRAIERHAEVEGTALGAALLAGHVLGRFKTLRSGAKERVEVVRARVRKTKREERRRAYLRVLRLAVELAAESTSE